VAKRHFSAGSWLLSFELKDPTAMIATINRLTIPIKATGLGDTRSLVIPVAPTIYWEAGAQVRAEMGIADGLIRVSVGLEDEHDLIADFEHALAAAG
jgi:O-acetylhomoserine (thiol)-lyase